MTEAALAQELLQRLRSTSADAQLEALERCRAICRDEGIALYVMGGTVRDLLLARPGYDIDLSLEADVQPVAHRLAALTGGRAVIHQRFGTAKVTGSEFQLDLARTRRESYPHPGSLPVVEPATLSEDLYRRDFTVNAIALRLEPTPEVIIDPFRGVADVRSSLLRVLHERSFQDDATRMLRAVRYAARLEFKIATQTAALIRRDLSFLGTVTGSRLRREFALLFHEPKAVAGSRLARDLGILQAVHPALGLSESVAERWQDALVGTVHASLEELGFAVLANPSDEGIAASVSKWLHLTGSVEETLHDLVRLKSQSSKLASMHNQPSQVTHLLDRHRPGAVWALGIVAGGETARACSQYLETWRHVRPELTGNDLLAMGASQGAGLGATLQRLRDARLDGLITTREEEIALVRQQS